MCVCIYVCMYVCMYVCVQQVKESETFKRDHNKFILHVTAASGGENSLMKNIE